MKATGINRYCAFILSNGAPGYTTNGTWCYGDVSSTTKQETNSDVILVSLLGPYSKSISVYKCPSDPGNPAGTPRVRSISMNCFMNGIGGSQNTGTTGNNFKKFRKTGDLFTPTQWYVLLDERPTSINDGYFECLMGNNSPTTVFVQDDPSQIHACRPPSLMAVSIAALGNMTTKPGCNRAPRHIINLYSN